VRFQAGAQDRLPCTDLDQVSVEFRGIGIGTNLLQPPNDVVGFSFVPDLPLPLPGSRATGGVGGFVWLVGSSIQLRWASFPIVAQLFRSQFGCG
jgi:hypothetical protein